jgi:hypothetical protein
MMFPGKSNRFQLKILDRLRLVSYGKSDARQIVWEIVREFVRVDSPLVVHCPAALVPPNQPVCDVVAQLFSAVLPPDVVEGAVTVEELGSGFCYLEIKLGAQLQPMCYD